MSGASVTDHHAVNAHDAVRSAAAADGECDTGMLFKAELKLGACTVLLQQ